jgi:hypothetical protein
MMMTAAALSGVWLWWTGSLTRLFKMPVVVPLIFLLATTLAVKSAGAIAMLVLGLGVLFGTRLAKTYLIVFVLCAAPFVYMAARSVGGWDGQGLLEFVETTMERERALSLLCRFENENILVNKAMQKPLFGWGPNGANLEISPDGVILSIPDGLWVIAVGVNGVVGLLALFGALLVPVALVKRRFRAAAWGDPMLAGVTCFAVILTLHAIDNLMNAMMNPIFVLALGGLSGIVAASPVARPAGGFPVVSVGGGGGPMRGRGALPT